MRSWECAGYDQIVNYTKNIICHGRWSHDWINHLPFGANPTTLTGASIYDVRKILWLFDPSCQIQNSRNLVPFVCFLGPPTPTHCGRHIWKPPMTVKLRSQDQCRWFINPDATNGMCSDISKMSEMPSVGFQLHNSIRNQFLNPPSPVW